MIYMYLTVILLCHCVVEDRNFALFNFVNEQNNEAEALKDQINQVNVLSLFDGAHGSQSSFISSTLTLPGHSKGRGHLIPCINCKKMKKL